MTESLRALLTGAIDYAGTFPPAKLDLPEALQNFRAYLQQPDAWLLKRFVCPAHWLAQIPELIELRNREIRLSVIGSSNPSTETMERQLERDFEIMYRSGMLPYIETIEWNLPQASRNFSARHLEMKGWSGIAVYFEFATSAPEGSPEWRAELGELVELLEARRRGGDEQRGKIGLKFRTGGLTAGAFPSSAALAAVICACRDAGVFWKATAGLHHALPHYDDQLQCRMHGFLNVFSAAILADVHGLGAARVEAILDIQDAGLFHFATDNMGCQELIANVDQISAARRRSLRSFGSCSFEEPLADLEALGLL